MDCFDHELHPVYGAVPRDGELVQPGDILGLSVDTHEVVTAPISGRVRLVSEDGHTERHLWIEITPVQTGGGERIHSAAA